MMRVCYLGVAFFVSAIAFAYLPTGTEKAAFFVGFAVHSLLSTLVGMRLEKELRP